MSEPISIACPICGVSMQLRDRSKLGKKANCPNCQNLFVLAEAVDGATADRPREEGGAASPAVSRRPSAGHRSGKTAGERIRAHQAKPGGGSKTGLFIGGGIVAVLLLVGMGLWAAGLFSGGENPLPKPPLAGGDGKNPPLKNKLNLAYLPPDMELFIQFKLADAWQTPLLTQLAGLPQLQAGLLVVEQNLGLAPADVASLTVGLSGVSAQAKQGVEGNPKAAASAAREKFTAVVRLHKPVDADSLKLVENGCKQRQHDGKAYYLFQPAADDPPADTAKPLALFLAEPQLIVLGSEKQIQAAITSGGKQTRRTELDFVDPDPQLLIVFVPQEKSVLTDALPAGGGPGDPAGEMALKAAQSVRGVGISISVGSSIDLQLQANCTDDKAASEIKQLLDGLIAEGRAGFEQSRDAMFGMDQIIEPVLASLQTSLDSTTVTLAAHVSDQTIAAAKPLAALFFGRMIGGMMGGGKEESLDGPVEAPTPSGQTDSPNQ